MENTILESCDTQLKTDLNNHFEIIVEIDTSNKNSTICENYIRTVTKHFSKSPLKDINPRIWILFGKSKKSKKWECLQVGSSTVSIAAEIRANIRIMFSPIEKATATTHFYQDAYEYFTYTDKDSMKYHHIFTNYSSVIFYEVDVNKYVTDDAANGYNKINYAEVKCAYTYKARYWNPAPATRGNQEREIVKKLFATSKNFI